MTSAGLQPPGRKGLEQRLLLGEARSALRIQLLEKPLVLPGVGELPRGPKQERLLNCSLEPVMPLLHIAVLMRGLGPHRTRLHPVVAQQSPADLRDFLRLLGLSHRRGQPILLVSLRHPTLPSQPPDLPVTDHPQGLLRAQDGPLRPPGNPGILIVADQSPARRGQSLRMPRAEAGSARGRTHAPER